MNSIYFTFKSRTNPRTGIALSSVLFVLCAAGLGAQTTQGAGDSGKKTRRVVVDSDYGNRKQTPQGIINTLRGKVKIVSEETTLITDLATYNEDTSVANSPGKLKMDDATNTLTGDTGVAFYKTRDVKIRDNVVMLIRPRKQDQNAPEGSSKRQFKDPVTVNCAKLDYNWKTQVADMTGNLTFKQKDRTVTADRAVYDGKTETLTLFDNVHYTNAKGDDGHSDKAIAILKDGAEEFTSLGIKKSGFTIEDDESDTGTNTAKPATATTTPVPVPGAPSKTPTVPGTTPATNPPGTTPAPGTVPPAPVTLPPTNPTTPPVKPEETKP